MPHRVRESPHGLAGMYLIEALLGMARRTTCEVKLGSHFPCKGRSYYFVCFLSAFGFARAGCQVLSVKPIGP